MSHLCQIDYYYEEKKMLDSNEPMIVQEGMNRLLAEAEKGSHEAQAIVGESYYYGIGFPQDYEKAFYWCKKASVTGAGYSNVTLGNMFEFGKGVKQDYIEAVRWYKKEVSNDFTYASEDMNRCFDKMDKEGIPREKALHGFPKHFLEAYGEWFAETNRQKMICDNPSKNGDLFSMGHYTIESDQKISPILWRVIGEDEEQLLVISEYCIHWLPYNDRHICSWEDSLLCSFLQELYENYFTEAERLRMIQKEDIKEPIFALSIKEANTYLKSHRDRRATATPYAILRGAHIVSEETLVREFADSDCGLPHAVCWWLRDRGFSPMYAADVMPDGWVCDSGDDMEEAGGVRPAMWIKK